MKKRPMSYDQKSYDLALHFLQDSKIAKEHAQDFARAIQLAAEDWLEAHEPKAPEPVQ